MWYKHTATIKFSGRFPIDMLRFDSCFPATGMDTAKIERSLLRERGGGKEEVQVCAYSDRKDHWTLGRWKSFLAVVSEPFTCRA